jgi:hypothetical protein
MSCPCGNLSKAKKVLAITGVSLAAAYGAWFGAYKAGWVASACPIDCAVKAVQEPKNP